MLKLNQYPEIHCAIRDAFIEEIENGYSTWSSEHTGLLHLGIDERDDIKIRLIKPHIDGFDKFTACFDEEGYTRREDDDVIGEFEARAEAEMQNLESQFIEWMKRQLR